VEVWYNRIRNSEDNPDIGAVQLRYYSAVENIGYRRSIEE